MLLKKLWADEVGALASLETVMIGTVGVLAMAVGLSRVSEAINAELSEMAMAVRAFDQSFATTGYNSTATIQTGVACKDGALSTVNTGAFKAGSGFVQQPPNLNVQQVSNQGQNSGSVDVDLAGGDFGNFRQGQFGAQALPGGAQAFPGAAQSFPGAAQGFAAPAGRGFDGGAAIQSFNTPNGLPPAGFNRANKLFESANCDVQ